MLFDKPSHGRSLKYAPKKFRLELNDHILNRSLFTVCDKVFINKKYYIFYSLHLFYPVTPHIFTTQVSNTDCDEENCPVTNTTMVEHIKIISAKQVADILHYDELIPIIEKALADFSGRPESGIIQPIRTVLHLPSANGYGHRLHHDYVKADDSFCCILI